MTGMKIPVFERGSILTYDMLEQLKDYFMQAVTIPYAEYSMVFFVAAELRCPMESYSWDRG